MELLIDRVEKKTTKNGKAYWLVNGKYYVWSDLNLAEGTKYNVAVEQNGQYPKITDAVQIAAPAAPPAPAPTASYNSATGSKEEMMLLSYAKDIAIDAFGYDEHNKNPFTLTINRAIATRLAYVILMDRHKNIKDFGEDVKLLRTIAEELGIQDIEITDEPIENSPAPSEEADSDNTK